MKTVEVTTTREQYLDEFLLHTDALYHFAVKLTQNDEDAQDLVQDTYLRAFKYHSHYELGTNSRSWLFRMMYNLFINDYRRKQKSPFVEIDDEKNDHPYYNRPVRPDVFQNTFSDEVMLAFNNLKSEFKSAIFLRDFEGLKYDEISKILDIPVCTVKTRIHRARTLMRRSLVDSGFYSRNN
ncbi:MAG: RNA polymerase sigma factor [Cytophagales bacterium]|nr:RNA polymerase sigma factor [Cytophagales bacterium]